MSGPTYHVLMGGRDQKLGGGREVWKLGRFKNLEVGGGAETGGGGSRIRWGMIELRCFGTTLERFGNLVEIRSGFRKLECRVCLPLLSPGEVLKEVGR